MIKQKDVGVGYCMAYVYILEDYAYSDFEYHILTHEKHYTKSEFEEMVKEALKKTKIERYHIMFHIELFNILFNEYGFRAGCGTVPVLHITDLDNEI